MNLSTREVRTIRRIASACLVATTLISSALSAQGRGQLYPEPPVPDEWGQPQTLKDLVHSVPLVVYGEVQRVRPPRLIDTRGGSPLVGRMQAVAVLAVIHVGAEFRTGPHGEALLKRFSEVPSVRAGDQIQVLQPGGTTLVGGRELTSAYQTELFAVGQPVVLFLVPSHEGAWEIVWKDAGFLPIDPATQMAAVPSGLRKMEEFRNGVSVSVKELLQTLAAAEKAGER